MQHLKSTGGDGVLLEAPSTKGKGKARADLELVLPPEALPSATELPRNYASEGAVPAALAGLRPDMDPHLRQALEALEDDAFVDDALADDFFGELLADGERAPEEEFAHGSDEDGFADAFAKAARIERGANADADEGEVAGWEDRFAAFKRAQAAGPTSDDEPSEGGDTVGTLPALSVLGGKRRRKGTSDASGYSMSSASMFRNAGLSALDERFERLEQEYADDADELDDEEDDEGGEGAPELITSRADFDAMMDDFLDNYEILGRQMVPVLPGATPAAKLAAYRTALADGGRLHASDDADDGDILMPTDVDAPRDRWDCETVLSTYSNLENHPRLIRARDSRPVPRIRLDPRTGLPVVDAPASAPTPKLRTKAADSSATDDGSDTDIDRRMSLHAPRKPFTDGTPSCPRDRRPPTRRV
jgi:protein LTV1